MKILLVDLSVLIYKFRYSFTNVECPEIFGVFYFLKRVLPEFDRIYFIGDGKPVRQSVIFSDYKLNREYNKEKLKLSPNNVIKRFLFLDKVYFVYNPNMEADDTAKYVLSFLNSDDIKYILTTDFDWYQFLSEPNTYIADKEKVLNDSVRSNTFSLLMDYNKLYKEKGIYAESIPLYKVFRGDKSDGVKPMKISESDAILLANEFKTLENLKGWANSDEVVYGSSKLKSFVKDNLSEIEKRYMLFKIDPEYIPEFYNKTITVEEAKEKLKFLEGYSVDYLNSI